MKSVKREPEKGIELLNQKNVRMLVKKEMTSTWEYWKRLPSNKRR